MLFLKSGKGSSKSDDEIISIYRKTRDSQYIGIFFDRYSHLVFAVSMKYLKNEDDSKDNVLKVFEKLPEDLIRYDIKNFSAWLHTVTKNLCFRFLMQNKNYFVDVKNIPDLVEDDEDNFTKIFLPFLDNAISELNLEQKTCIDLFYIQNMSYEEVSSTTGFTMNQVKSYIQNGKRNLKIILLKKSNEK